MCYSYYRQNVSQKQTKNVIFAQNDPKINMVSVNFLELVISLRVWTAYSRSIGKTLSILQVSFFSQKHDKITIFGQNGSK